MVFSSFADLFYKILETSGEAEMYLGRFELKGLPVAAAKGVAESKNTCPGLKIHPYTEPVGRVFEIA